MQHCFSSSVVRCTSGWLLPRHVGADRWSDADGADGAVALRWRVVDDGGGGHQCDRSGYLIAVGVNLFVWCHLLSVDNWTTHTLGRALTTAHKYSTAAD